MLMKSDALDYHPGTRIPKRARLSDKDKYPLAGQPGSPPGKSEYIIRDDLQPGFYRLYGRRVVTYVAVADGVREGRRRTMKEIIGRVGDPGLTADKARKRAAAHITAVKAGSRDPNNRKPKAPSLRSAWAEYKADLQTEGRVRKSTIDFYERNVNLQLKAIADRPLTELQKKREMRAWFKKITAKHGRGSANAAARTLSAIFNFAFKKLDDDNVLVFNPVKALTLHKLGDPVTGKSKGGMVPEQIPAWGRQYRAMENRLRAEFHLFTLLSGSRPEVLTRIRLEHIDWRARTLFLDKPKGKASGVIPLSRPMMRCICRAIQAGRMEKAGSLYLFPSALSKTGHLEEWKENRTTTLAQYGRDLRKTFRTLADRLGIPTEQSEALMLHGTSGSHNVYLIEDDRTLAFRAAQDRISAAIVAAVFPEGAPRTLHDIEPWAQRRPGRPVGWRKPVALPQPEVQASLNF